MQWREMECFRGIDLNDSFVLSWKVEKRRLCFVLEASIWPGSEHYQPPEKKEYTCYRPATLYFRDCDSVSGLNAMSEVRPSVDTNGEVDYGNIDSLTQIPGGFEILGDFGNVLVKGGQLDFRVET